MKTIRKGANRRAPNLTGTDIEAILALLDGWTGPLTWSLLVDAIKRRLHTRYTRQTLHRHKRILRDFQLRKESLRSSPAPKHRAATREMQILLDDIKRLKAENARVKQENERLLKQFAVWAYNARIRGLDETALSRPLPPATSQQIG